jgi:hypothetical protein
MLAFGHDELLPEGGIFEKEASARPKAAKK